MRRFLATLTVLSALAGSASPAAAAPIEIGHIPECLEVVPAAISLQPGATTNLDTRVLLDGVSAERGQAVFETAKRSYAPLGVNLVPSFEAVSFSGTDAAGLNAQAKAHNGGQRPAGIDVVYTLTNKDIQADGNTAVAGLADCIGGVAFPDSAFAVGENLTVDEAVLLGIPELTLARNLTAKVASHEIGHLMGAHHHYANCVEGLLTETDEISPCTLMFNIVDASSLNFSTLEGLVVRGHAELYAVP